MTSSIIQGGPKSKPLPTYHKIVLNRIKSANEVRFRRQLKEIIKHHNIIRGQLVLNIFCVTYFLTSMTMLTYLIFNHYFSYTLILPCRSFKHRRHVRSSTTTTLVFPPVQRSTLSDRAFPVAAPRAWNSLPPSIRTVSCLVPFRHQLKTFLFVHSFDWHSLISPLL